MHAKDTPPLNPVKFLHCGVTATKNVLTANEQQRQKTYAIKSWFLICT